MANIWTQTINNLTPEQARYLSDLMSGRLYGTDAARSYFTTNIIPELTDSYNMALRNLKSSYGPMSLGSSYKIANARMIDKLAETRAAELSKILYQWKQLEAQAQQAGLNREAFTTLAGYNPSSTGGGGFSYSPSTGRSSSSGYSSGTSSGTGTGTSSYDWPSLFDYYINPTTTGNYYYDWPTGTSSATATSTGTSSEFANPFTGEIYNYSPGVSDYSYEYDTGTDYGTDWSGYDYGSYGNDYGSSGYDYGYDTDYEWTGFW